MALTTLILPAVSTLTLILSFLIGKNGVYLSLLILIAIGLLEIVFKFREKKILYSPYFYLLFSPFLLIRYSSMRDFQIRTLTFVFIVYILAIAVENRKIQLPFFVDKYFSSVFRLWLTAFLLFSILSVYLFQKNIYLSGDEPHFLVITQSIVEDGDFDLRNNYKKEAYFKIKPELKGTGWKYQPHILVHNQKVLSFHMPGVSFLMVPFMTVYRTLGLTVHPAIYYRIAFSFIGAFFALAFYFLLHIYFPDKKTVYFWLFLLISFPILFHSVHLYPELPAALISVCIFIFTFTRYRNWLLSGLFMSMLPWFHVKYYPVVLIFSVAIGIEMFKSFKNNRKLRELSYFFFFPVISCCLLLLYCKLLYGTFNPTAIFPKQDYFGPLLLKIKVFFAYFLDQRDGLISYAPYLLFAFFGFKSGFKRQNLLLWLLLSYVGLHAFTTVRGAYAPAGRPLIFVVWILLLLTANSYFSGEHSPVRRYFFKVAAGITVFYSFWLLRYPLFMYQPVVSTTSDRSSDMLRFFSAENWHLSSFFPSFLTHPGTFHLANILWILLIVIALGLFYYYGRNGQHPMSRRGGIKYYNLIIFLLLFYMFAFHPHFHLKRRHRLEIGNIPVYKTAQLFTLTKEISEAEKEFRIKSGHIYDLFIELAQAKDARVLGFEFRGDKADHWAVYTKQKRIKCGTDVRSMGFKVRLSTLKTLKIKEKHYAHLSIHVEEKNNPYVYLTLKALHPSP